MNCVWALDRGAIAMPVCKVTFVPVSRQSARDKQRQDIIAKIRELEMRIDAYSQAILKSRLSSTEIEEITRLSEASLQNIAAMQKIAKQIEEASEEG